MSARKTPVASHTWARAADNWYVEDEWCTQRLVEAEGFIGRTVDPSAGGGNTIRGAAAAGTQIDGFDLRDRGNPNVTPGADFFQPEWINICHGQIDNIVSNPPYGAAPKEGWTGRRRLEEEFLLLALGRARRRVALYLRAGWAHGEDRALWLRSTPFAREYRLTPRPSCPPGEMLANGGKAQGGKVDYTWFVWEHGHIGPPTLHWLHRSGQ